MCRGLLDNNIVRDNNFRLLSCCACERSWSVKMSKEVLTEVLEGVQGKTLEPDYLCLNSQF